jgi:hypothetical protein
VNGTEVSGESELITLGSGSIKVVPAPDADGTYAAGTVVNLWAYNNNPRGGGSFNGVDSVDPKGVGAVIMNADRSVDIFFY